MNSTSTNLISINKAIRSGKPCIAGTRITVGDILAWLASDMSVEEILEDFPELNKNQILAALAYASERDGLTAALVA